MTLAPDLEESSTQERLRYAKWLELCRRRLLPFIKHCFIGEYEIFPETRIVCEALERFFFLVRERKSPRLLIIEPPRVGKSETVSRMFLPWVLGHEPDWHVGIVSYGDDFAWELSAEARAILADVAFAEVFGDTYQGEGTQVVELDPNTKAVKHWKIKGRRGGMRAAGINGSLTGKGYQIVVFDDPTKGRKEADSRDYRDDQARAFKGTFLPRVEPGGGVILMGTAWNIDDLLGRIQKENEENRDDPQKDHWEIIHIPARALPGRIDPLGRQVGEWMGGRRTPLEWEHQEANTESREWAAQYLGIPMPEEGGIFHPYEDFRFEDPPEEYEGPRYGFSDNSHAKSRSSDFSGILIAQVEPEQTIGILDVFQGRVQYPELKALGRHLYDGWKLWAMVIEDYSAGRALIQEYKRDAKMVIKTYRPDRDKTARANAAQSAMADWKVRLPLGDRFPSGLAVKVFLDELANFQADTNNAHDDLVDVFTMCMILLAVRNQARPREVLLRDFAFVP